MMDGFTLWIINSVVDVFQCVLARFSEKPRTKEPVMINVIDFIHQYQSLHFYKEDEYNAMLSFVLIIH